MARLATSPTVGDGGQAEVADAGGESDGGGDPQAGCGGQVPHRGPVAEDHTRPDEADPDDDLAGDARDVDPDVGGGCLLERPEPDGGDDPEHAGAQRDRDVGPQARGLVVGFALEADDGAEPDGHEHPDGRLDFDTEVVHLSRPCAPSGQRGRGEGPR